MPKSTRNSPPAPLRVAHVVDQLALAGMEYGVIKLVNRLDPQRVAPSIVCLRHQTDEARALLAAGIQVTEMRKNPGRNWRLIGRRADRF
ncbi:MAG: hypothetical protein ACRENN_07860, partial [Candidatus Eiseniibacteriota bacterium]